MVRVITADGSVAAEYTYNAWGKVLTATGTLAEINPIRYRGYYYDDETGLYYLQSRYYDAEIGRFIKADDTTYLGASGGALGYNLFAYCGNNPVMGLDPTGEWNWGGVIVGLGIMAAAIITVATFGVGSGLGVVVASAAITTGATMTYAAATDSVMVMDISLSEQKSVGAYGKMGVSVLIDFNEDGGVYSYNHYGFGIGNSSGLTYSVGLVSNFEEPNDYSKHFTDYSLGKTIGIDHCYNPNIVHNSSTQATSVTFGTGNSYSVGYDYYSTPYVIMRW